MIGREVGVLESRRHLGLLRRYFVVTRLRGYSQLEQFPLRIDHEGEHPLRNRAEVVVLELLSLGWRSAEQRSSGSQQIRSREEKMAIDEEVLLLGARI